MIPFTGFETRRQNAAWGNITMVGNPPTLVLLVSSAVLEPCLTFDPGEGSDPKGSPGGLWYKNKIIENAAEERNLCMHSQLPITALGHSWDLCQVTNQRQNSNLDLCETHGWPTP